MSQFTWLASGLKSLRLCCTTAALGNAGQTRLVGNQPAAAQDKPKKPLTPYFRFMAKLRPEIMRSNPTLKAIEISRLAGERWSKLDEASKKRYADEYKSEMAGFQTIIDKYNASLSPEQRDAAQQAKVDRQLRRERREHRKRVKELGKPKRPATAFLRYLQTKIKPGAGLEEYRNAARVEGAKWKNLDESEKAPFLSKYKEEAEKYQKDLLKWEGQMLKQGNDDLVRIRQLAQSTAAASRKSK